MRGRIEGDGPWTVGHVTIRELAPRATGGPDLWSEWNMWCRYLETLESATYEAELQKAVSAAIEDLAGGD